MEIISIKENEDGSANVEMDVSEEEIKIFIQYAITDILEKYIEENNKSE